METTLSSRAKLVTFWILAGLTVLGLAHFFKILTPFLWAAITAYVFQPLINVFSRRLHLPRPLVAVVIYLAIVACIVMGALTAWPVLRQQATELVNEVPGVVETGVSEFDQRFPELTEQWGLDPAAVEKQAIDFVNQLGSQAPRTALTVAQRLFHLVIELLIYLIATFFFFIQGHRLAAWFRDLLPTRYQPEADRVLGEINRTLGAYLRGQALLVLIMSGTTYAVLRILDMPYAFAIALATGLLELIPILGPWSAGAIAVSVAALDPTPPFGWSNLTLAIAVAVIYFALRQLEDILVIPTLIGRIVHLHPLLLMSMLLIGTAIGGVLGLLLAVPIAAVARILLRYIYGKLIAEPERHILPIDARDQLTRVQSRLPEHTNQQVVLLVHPGVVQWDDLPAIHRLSKEATRLGITLSAVALDPIAGSICTAVGLETTIVGAEAGRQLTLTGEGGTPTLATVELIAKVR
ncbi:MAG: AI-2E family transporter [Thermomicrobiales bacterium]